MFDNRPVGVLDSGLGGLTAVRELFRLMPHESVVFFGDTARVPYGTRGVDTILRYTKQDIAFLETMDIKALVVACGTISTTAAALFSDYTLPIIGVVGPAAKAATNATKTGRIGLMGTEASIRSGSYETLLHTLNPSFTVTPVPCPLLVPLIENGRFLPGDCVTETVLHEYLVPIRKADVDTLILGCTHYPLLAPLLGKLLSPSVTLVDPGYETAHSCRELLVSLDRTADPAKQGRYAYYVSDSVEPFARFSAFFLQGEAAGDVKKVDIDV